MKRTVYSDDYLGRSFDLRHSNCWHLARDVWRDMTGVNLDDLTPERLDVDGLQIAADQASAGPSFVRLDGAQEPCLVLMRRTGQMPHIGVMLRGKVLHMRPSGVVFQSLVDAVAEFASVAFYLPRGPAS